MSVNDSEEECSNFYQSAYEDDDDNGTHDETQQQGNRDEDEVISVISQGVGVASFDEGNLVETVSLDYGIRRNTCKQFCCSFCLPRSPLPTNNSTDKDDCDDLADIEKPSNEKLLALAFISFFTLTICQTFASFAAKSESMMGDSAAMVVDAITYGFNLVAERKKIALQKSSKTVELVPMESTEEKEYEDDNKSNESGSNDDFITSPISSDLAIYEQNQQLRSKRKIKLALEIFPPLFSVSVLIVLNSIILRRAIQTLINESNGITEKTPDVKLMFIFSFLNLLVDLLNMFYFSKADHAMGYNAVERDVSHITTESQHEDLSNGSQGLSERVKQDIVRLQQERHREKGGAYSPVNEGNYGHFEVEDAEDVESIDVQNNLKEEKCDFQSKNGLHHEQHLNDLVNSRQHGEEETNLNMCSAYTHVFADTLRSIAVITAAIVGAYAEGVSPERADASAAVVVSIIIVLALFPLFSGLRKSIIEYIAIYREQSTEWMDISRLMDSETFTGDGMRGSDAIIPAVI